jgi:hypothetical protein
MHPAISAFRQDLAVERERGGPVELVDLLSARSNAASDSASLCGVSTTQPYSNTGVVRELTARATHHVSRPATIV